jgi:hypothetical protein
MLKEGQHKDKRHLVKHFKRALAETKKLMKCMEASERYSNDGKCKWKANKVLLTCPISQSNSKV